MERKSISVFQLNLTNDIQCDENIDLTSTSMGLRGLDTDRGEAPDIGLELTIRILTALP